MTETPVLTFSEIQCALIAELRLKTERGLFEWEKKDDNEFLLRLRRGTLLICKAKLHDGYKFLIFNDTNEEIERLAVASDREPDEYELLEKLFIAVRRRFYRVDEVLGSLMQEISSR